MNMTDARTPGAHVYLLAGRPQTAKLARLLGVHRNTISRWLAFLRRGLEPLATDIPARNLLVARVLASLEQALRRPGDRSYEAPANHGGRGGGQ
jgi:hypothetical protein